MANFRTEDPAFRRASLVASLAVAGVAAAVYAATLATYVFPGDSARLLVQWTGIDALAFPEFPLWGWFVRLFGGAGALASVAVRTNALSLVCGVVSAYLICRLMAFVVWQVAAQEDSVKFAKGASLAAGLVAALTFVFGQHFIRLFLGANAGPETIAVGAQYLRVMGAAYLMCVLMRGFLAVITGAGDVNVGAVAGFAELAGRVAFSYLLAPYFGILGVWIATPISWGCGAIVPMVRYFSGKWKQKALV